MQVPKPVGEPTVVWKKYGKKVVCQNFEFPDGHVEDFYLFGGGRPTIVLAVTKAGNIVAGRQYRPGANMVLDEVFGGHAEKPGETPEEIARRELLQESGYSAGALVNLGWFYLDPPVNITAVDVFLALDCERVAEPKLDRSEVIEIFERPVAEWYAQMRTSGQNAITLVASLWAEPYLRRSRRLWRRFRRFLRKFV